MSHHRRLLVLGAGELGLSVLRNLAKRASGSPEISVGVMMRPSSIASDDPAKMADISELIALNVELVPGDLVGASEAQLSAIFEEFDTVISCTGFVAGSGTQRKIARAALAARVRRFVPWQFGVDYDVIGRGSAQDLFDEQLDVRDMLRSQATTAWIIISTGMFTSFLFEPFFGVVDLADERVNALGSWQTAVTVTTPEDIGVLTSEIIFALPEIASQVVYTAGDTITYQRLADTIDRVLSLKVVRTEWTVAELREELATDPVDAIKKYRVVFAEGRGVAWDPKATYNYQNNIEVTDVEGWMRKNLLPPRT